MARVRHIEWGNQAVKPHPTEVDCFVQAIDGAEKLLHITTFGSDSRVSASKSSQSVQLNQEQAHKLRAIIDQVFPQAVV